MISDFFEIFFLSIIQGVFEFLPVSSAAHLILASNLYELNNKSLLIDISLHLGSLLAILFYFKEDIFNFHKNKNLFYKIIIGTLPLIIAGYFLYSTNLIEHLRNIKVIAWTTLIFGVLIYIGLEDGNTITLTEFNIYFVLFMVCFAYLVTTISYNYEAAKTKKFLKRVLQPVSLNNQSDWIIRN